MTASPAPHAIQTTLRPGRSLEENKHALKARSGPAPTSAPTFALPEFVAGANQPISPTSTSTSSALSPSLSALIAPNHVFAASETSSTPLPGATPPLIFTDTVRLSIVVASAPIASRTALSSLQVQSVCIGHGVDAQSIGLLSTLIVPTVVGLGIWVSPYNNRYLVTQTDRFCRSHLLW